MKKISAFFIFFIVAAALVVWMGLAMPAAAQKTAPDEKTSGTIITLESNARPQPAETRTDKTTPSPLADQSEAAKKPTAAQKSADYWFNRGALCATYGNDKAAIRYFQKALSLDPQKSGAYFSQGISYGQLGQYTRAIALIDKALELDPENGLYYYGRGRVYLLAKDRDKALADFKKAAALDDEDAQAYLQRIAQTP